MNGSVEHIHNYDQFYLMQYEPFNNLEEIHEHIILRNFDVSYNKKVISYSMLNYVFLDSLMYDFFRMKVIFGDKTEKYILVKIIKNFEFFDYMNIKYIYSFAFPNLQNQIFTKSEEEIEELLSIL